MDCRTHAKIVHVCIVGVDNRIGCSEHENFMSYTQGNLISLSLISVICKTKTPVSEEGIPED